MTWLGGIAPARAEDQPAAAIAAAYPAIFPHTSISDTDRVNLKQRGGFAVYLPLGSDDRGLLSELAQIQALPLCRFVNDQDIAAGALTSAAALLLPDLGEYAPVIARDERIKSFLDAGGGIYAAGTAIAHIHQMGLFAGEIIPFRARGNVVVILTGLSQFQTGAAPWVLGAAGPILQKVCAQRGVSAFTVFSYGGHMYDGPLFRLADDSPLTVLAHAGISQDPARPSATIPGLAAGAVGKGRLVLSSAGSAGMNSQDQLVNAEALTPVASPTADDIYSLTRPLVRKQLLLYAAGLTAPLPKEK